MHFVRIPWRKWIYLTQGQVVGSCECGDELSGPLIVGNFLTK